MQDEYLRSRGFALTLARRAVGDLRRDRFRQLRNYLDLCQALANKSRYSDFFAQAQQILQRADSLYDPLIQTLVEQVEGERLCNFGIDFGVGGMIYGADRLKKEIECTGAPAAWLNTANGTVPGLEQAVCRAEEAGKYVWVLYAADAASAANVAVLAKNHPFSAFSLVAPSAVFGAMPFDAFDNCWNLSLWVLLPSLALDVQTCAVAEKLKEKKLLYGFAALVGNETAAQAVDPQWLESVSRWVPFCMYAREPDMGTDVACRFRQAVLRHRTTSAAPLLLLDWDGDLKAINSGISAQVVIGAPVGSQAPFPFSRG